MRHQGCLQEAPRTPARGTKDACKDACMRHQGRLHEAPRMPAGGTKDSYGAYFVSKFNPTRFSDLVPTSVGFQSKPRFSATFTTRHIQWDSGSSFSATFSGIPTSFSATFSGIPVPVSVPHSVGFRFQFQCHIQWDSGSSF